LRLLEAPEIPAGWLGKNHALWQGAKRRRHMVAILPSWGAAVLRPYVTNQPAAGCFLQTRDAELLDGAAARALRIAKETGAALVSFSPEQVTKAWYERALIPFVYSRLAKHFSYEAVRDANSKCGGGEGQFLMIRSDVYEEVGGHKSVAGEVLEDVALAKRVKAARHRIWFGSGVGAVRVRMYRSFGAMWEGWKKNLYLLVGRDARRGLSRAVFCGAVDSNYVAAARVEGADCVGGRGGVAAGAACGLCEHAVA